MVDRVRPDLSCGVRLRRLRRPQRHDAPALSRDVASCRSSRALRLRAFCRVDELGELLLRRFEIRLERSRE
jgi:hypothetical protein